MTGYHVSDSTFAMIPGQTSGNDDDTIENVYSYLEDVAAEISADAPAVSADVVTDVVSGDYTLTKPSAVLWRIGGVRLRDSTDTDYLLDASISRTHSVNLSGMDVSFDENVNMYEVDSMFTPDIEPDDEVVVSVRSVLYVTKRGVYEIHVQTSTGKVSVSDKGEDSAEE